MTSRVSLVEKDMTTQVQRRSRPKQVKDLRGTHRKDDGPLPPRCGYTLCECSVVGPWGPCSTSRGTVAKSCFVQDFKPPASWGSPTLSYSVLVWWRLLPTSCLWFRVPNSLTISWSREKQTAKGGCPLLWKPRPESSTLQLPGTEQMCRF